MIQSKQAQARLSIIEKLRKQGAPVSPFPGKEEQEVAGETDAVDDADEEATGDEKEESPGTLDSAPPAVGRTVKLKLRK